MGIERDEGRSAPPLTLDIGILQEFVGTDPARTRELLVIFASMARETAQVLAEAIRAAHCEDATAAAHKLKSAARMAGALPLGDLCEEMEGAGHAGSVEQLTRLLPSFETEMSAVLGAVADSIGRLRA